MTYQANPSRREWMTADGGFLPLRLGMLLSPAYQARTRPLALILERLEIEHLRHGGKHNGGLCVSYRQFEEYGVSPRTIRPSLSLGEALGLMQVIQIQEVAGDIRPENMYRLTYVPERDKKAPTDEWRYVTADQIAKAVEEFRARTTTKKGQTEAETDFKAA